MSCAIGASRYVNKYSRAVYNGPNRAVEAGAWRARDGAGASSDGFARFKPYLNYGEALSSKNVHTRHWY